jgi:hypothetical protein
MENATERKISSWAVATFFLSIFSFLGAKFLQDWITFIEVVLIAIGLYSLRDVKKNHKKGKWFAIIGILFSLVPLLAFLFWLL